MIKRSIFILSVALVILLGAEWALRAGSTYIVQRDLKTSQGSIEANPEFLIQYQGGKRRFVPNTHVIIKNHYLSGQDVNVDINSLGLREDEFPAKRRSPERRILVLGDSITSGDYLNVNDVYVRQLQKLLNEHSDIINYRTINAGIGNIGTKEELDLLEEILGPTDPDLVILSFYLNDSRPPWGFAGEIGNYGWLRRHSLLASTLYRVLAQFQWVKAQDVDRFAWIPAVDTLAWRTTPSDFAKLTKLAEYDWGAAWQDSSWALIDKELNRLKELQAAHGFKVIVAIFPVIYQLQTEFEERRPQIRLSELANAKGFYVSDLYAILKTDKPSELFFDHCHLNSNGNRLVAETLEKAVKNVLPERG